MCVCDNVLLRLSGVLASWQDACWRVMSGHVQLNLGPTGPLRVGGGDLISQSLQAWNIPDKTPWRLDRLVPTLTCLRKTGHSDFRWKSSQEKETQRGLHRSTPACLYLCPKKRKQTLSFSKGKHVVSVAMAMSTDHAPILRVGSIQTSENDWEVMAETHKEQSQKREDKWNHAEGNESHHVQTKQRDVVPLPWMSCGPWD